MSQTGGELLLKLFEANNAEYIFCSPGAEWVPVWDALSERYATDVSAPSYINCRHELLAVSMAIGHARETGEPSPVLLHVGVGPLHAAMAIRAAYQTEVPVLILAAEALDHTDEGEAPPPGGHWINPLSDLGGPASLIKPYAKWTNRITNARALVDSVHRGFHIARTSPKGPVFLSIDRDLLFNQAPRLAVPQPSPPAALPDPRTSDLEHVAGLLTASERPIIITDHLGRDPAAVPALIELAEGLGIPVFESSQLLFANFPKDHPLYMGDDAAAELQEADLVFVVASTLPWYPPSKFPSARQKVVFLDEAITFDKLPYWGYRVDIALAGDVGKSISRLTELARERRRDPSVYEKRLDHYRTRHDELMQKWRAEATAGENDRPILPRWFLQALSDLLPADAVILEETVRHLRVPIHRYLSKLEPGRYGGTIGGGLGVGLGQALGARLVHQDKPVVFLVGDGAFNYNPALAGLGLCAEYGVPLLVIILNNGGYIAEKISYHRFSPQGWGARHDQYLGVDITPQPDYPAIARALGAHGERVEDPAGLAGAVQRALAALADGKAALLDVILAES